MAGIVVFPPPSSAQDDIELLDDHYISVEDQRSGRRVYLTHVEDHEAQRALDVLLVECYSAIQNIKEKLSLYGYTITKRWKKYSYERRASILRAGAKDVFMGVYEQVEAWRPDPAANPWEVTDPYVSCILWLGQSGIEQLTKDHTRLLALLNVRSKYGPEQWATFDIRSARKSFVDGLGPPIHKFNANSVIMHGEAYGRMKKFDIDAARSFEEVGFPRAWVTISTQQMIAFWLSTIVDQLSVDAPANENTRLTAMVDGGLHGALNHASWSSYEHQEFAPPSAFNPDTILRKARDHLNMLADELEDLQTSPEAMRQYVLEEKANTEFRNPKSKEEVWLHVSQTLARSWTKEIERWQHLVAQCEHLKATLANSGIVEVTGTRLSKDVDAAIRRFGQVVHETLVEATAEWMTQIRTVDVMSEHIKRPVRNHRGTIRSIWGLDPNRHSDRIILHCLELSAVKHPRNYSWHLSKLKEQLLDTKYSTGLANWISGMALMDDFMVSWSFRQTIDQDDPQEIDAVNLGYAPRTKFSSTSGAPKMIIHAQSITPRDLECSQLLRRFCDLPLPRGLRDKKYLEKTTESRRILTRIWSCIREGWNERQQNLGTSDEFRARVLSQMSFDLSHEYLMRVAAERQQLQVEDEFEQSIGANREHGSGFVQQAWDQRGSTDGAVRKNLTKKSNAVHNDGVNEGLGRLTLDDDRLSNDGQPNNSLATVQRIAVKQDTLSVMSKIFSTSDGSSDVRWIVLLQALTDAGLAATPGAGSAMSFSNGHGTISIHKPHDRAGSVVHAVRLRGVGRRLSKWFGWTKETFVLREKNNEE